MVLAALVVAIISAVLTGVGLVYNRRSTRASERSADDAGRAADTAERSADAAARSADAAAVVSKLDMDRRHCELTPRFRIAHRPIVRGATNCTLSVFLLGPPELERLDGLTIMIRDDRLRYVQRRNMGEPSTQLGEQIWGPRRFLSNTGPDRELVPFVERKRKVATRGLSVGEELAFFLAATDPPPWSSHSQESWLFCMEPLLRLRLECHRDGWAPWILQCEMKLEDEESYIEIPEPT